jgi:hypothetical protein
MPEETKTDEILEAINAYANHNEKQLESIKSDIQQFQSKTEKRFDKIESTMITKDFLEDKLADLRGDLVVLTRKEDKKVNTLVDILKEKNVLNDDEVKKIIGMAPFAHIS